ncbi:MAG: tyrosine-type recombinase/integrase, partial [Acidobacteriaceae bacterium]
CTRDGRPYSVSGWNSAWRRLVKRSGIEDLHFHDVRAKALTDAQREAGRDYAQALAGHKSGDMTEAYVRARTTQKVRPLSRIVEETPFCRNEESGKPR